ncbi:MAG: hypothetical protein ACI9MR_004958, partial [Myxococcota bacterium]
MPIKRRGLLSAGLVLIAAPSLGVSILTRTGRALAGTEDEFRRYAKSSYTYCDAKVLSGYWKQPVSEAKARIGRKLGWRDEAILDSMLRDGRKAAMPQARDVCPYDESGYSYEDMEQLTKLWKGKDHQETKLRVARKLVAGDHKVVTAEIKVARGQQVQRYSVPEQAEDLRRFDKSGFTYCDAKVLAGYWAVPPMDAKLRVGSKIGKKKRKVVERKLVAARKVASKKATAYCPYHESGYDYTDMVSLADYWGVSMERTKTQAA